MDEENLLAEQFRPLGMREGWSSDMGPYEGVPTHIQQSLLDWISPFFFRRYRSAGGWETSFDLDLLQRAERQLRFSSEIVQEGQFRPYDQRQRLRLKLESDEKVLLSLIDFVLWQGCPEREAGALQAILTEGGSIYTVSKSTGKPQLERRVEPHVESVAKKEMARGGTPSDLLKVAWSSTLGLHPNPSEGYRNAVRAVEAAAVSMVLPNDPKATLGKVIGHLNATTDHWSIPLTGRRDDRPPVQTIIDMMGVLWTSQYDRHVTQGADLHIGQREADAALPLAAVLVHWLSTGILSKQS